MSHSILAGALWPVKAAVFGKGSVMTPSQGLVTLFELGALTSNLIKVRPYVDRTEWAMLRLTTLEWPFERTGRSPSGPGLAAVLSACRRGLQALRQFEHPDR